MLAFIFYQNQFINKYARKKKAKISESRSFLVRYRRTYVLKKYYTKLLRSGELFGKNGAR